MKRREFITLIGGAAAAWPLAARAQQGENVRRICVLTAGVGADDPDAQARNAAFELALQQLGWTSGRNLRLDYFWGLGQSDTIRKHMRRNWPPSRRTSFWPAAARAWRHCCKRRAWCRSCS